MYVYVALHSHLSLQRLKFLSVGNHGIPRTGFLCTENMAMYVLQFILACASILTCSFLLAVSGKKIFLTAPVVGLSQSPRIPVAD
jgi:hypothetical protein